MNTLSKVGMFVLALVILCCAPLKDIGKGPVGAPGPKGSSGQDGSNGAQGNTGTTGPQGNNGTSVAPIQLCPASYVPSYPNVFPEYALCLGDQLFGVYSANGGFLALLPPGTYSSNGISASCTFTIQPNCVVQ